MKILVTGGTGYIGSHTCVELLNKGHEVVIFDNLFNFWEHSKHINKSWQGLQITFLVLEQQTIHKRFIFPSLLLSPFKLILFFVFQIFIKYILW